MGALKVLAFWDEEARVWVAESEYVPGLATEAPTLEELLAKLAVMVPEFLEENGVRVEPPVELHLGGRWPRSFPKMLPTPAGLSAGLWSRE